jgi:hypothetical protein
VIDRAVVMYERAREHKRAEQRHRRRAQQELAKLETFCNEVGLDLEVVKGRTKSNGQGPRQQQAGG